MSSHHRRRRRTRSEGSSRRPSMLRLVALSAIGLTLFGAAYQTAFAGDNFPGPRPAYPQPEDEGSSDAAVAGIAIGGAAIVGGGLYAAGVFGGGAAGAGGGMAGAFAIGSEHECREPYPDLPAGHQIEMVNLLPEESSLRAGYARCFHLVAKSKTDGKWYSLTRSPDTTFTILNPGSTPLMQMDGRKNVFLLPISAPQAANGTRAVVVGSYTGPGGPLQDQASVRLRVPGGQALLEKPSERELAQAE